MGLFSFLKNAGAKIFSNVEKEAPKVDNSADDTAVTDMLNRQKALLLRNVVENLQLPVNNFDVVVNDATAIVYGEVPSQSDKEKVVLALGNVNGIEFVDDRLSVVEAAPEAVFYTVQKGDSLSKIAMAHYDGDWKKYTMIFEANKPMLKDPDMIYPGQVLRIPPVVA